MSTFEPDLMYRLSLKGIKKPKLLKLQIDQLVTDIKAASAWDADVEVFVDYDKKTKNQYTIGVEISGRGQPFYISKCNKSFLQALNKVRRIARKKVRQKFHRHRATDRPFVAAEIAS